MSLDIRIPIGLMFGIIGLILAVFGVVSDPALHTPLVDLLAKINVPLDLESDPDLYVRSLGINVNFVWGAVLVGFSIIMLGLARRAQRQARQQPKAAEKASRSAG